MRRGKIGGELPAGGACEFALTCFAEKSVFEMLRCAGKISKTRCTAETAGPAAGCRNGACIEGIVLQQSSLLPWCGGQGVDRQHCIACSGVFIPEQSMA
jgi:hypothetical protein